MRFEFDDDDQRNISENVIDRRIMAYFIHSIPLLIFKHILEETPCWNIIDIENVHQYLKYCPSLTYKGLSFRMEPTWKTGKYHSIFNC